MQDFPVHPNAIRAGVGKSRGSPRLRALAQRKGRVILVLNESIP